MEGFTLILIGWFGYIVADNFYDSYHRKKKEMMQLQHKQQLELAQVEAAKNVKNEQQLVNAL